LVDILFSLFAFICLLPGAFVCVFYVGVSVPAASSVSSSFLIGSCEANDPGKDKCQWYEHAYW